VKTLFFIAVLAAGLVAPSVAPVHAQDGQAHAKTLPVIVKSVKPKYTDDARARRIQGRVEVEAVVNTDGSVSNVRVTKSLDPGLDQQAVEATKQWKFKPGTVDGKPVAVAVNIEHTFTLK
jgi:TonB family protein